MPDDDSAPQQIADYGVRAQPALVARMRPQVTMTRVGAAVSALGVVSAGLALALYPGFSAQATGSGWATAAVVCSVLLLGICLFQLLGWRQAMADWRGERDVDLSRVTVASYLAHLASYAVLLVALYCCIAGSLAAGATSAAADLLAVTCLFMLAGQSLAAVQYLRVDGPSGTVPGHLRRLSRWRR